MAPQEHYIWKNSIKTQEPTKSVAEQDLANEFLSSE